MREFFQATFDIAAGVSERGAVPAKKAAKPEPTA